MCHINVMFIVTHTAAILRDYFQHNLFAPLDFGISFSVCESCCVWMFVWKCVLACPFYPSIILDCTLLKTRKTNQLMQYCSNSNKRLLINITFYWKLFLMCDKMVFSTIKNWILLEMLLCDSILCIAMMIEKHKF